MQMRKPYEQVAVDDIKPDMPQNPNTNAVFPKCFYDHRLAVRVVPMHPTSSRLARTRSTRWGMHEGEIIIPGSTLLPVEWPPASRLLQRGEQVLRWHCGGETTYRPVVPRKSHTTVPEPVARFRVPSIRRRSEWIRFGELEPKPLSPADRPAVSAGWEDR